TKNDIIAYYTSRRRSLIKQIDSGKITVAYPGYDQEKFKTGISETKINEVRKKYRIDRGYILFLSTLKPSKNIEGLLLGFQKLDKGKTQNLKLVVAGRKGWLFENIFTKVKSLGLEKKVIFTDFVQEQELPALMAGAEVFVLPSFWEGFGIPVVESMAIGVPVVVSNAGSLPEIVGEAGIIVDPYNPENIAWGIKKAMEEKEKLIAKGFKQAQQFNWLECGQKVIKILESIKE
ncbi:MAG: glycosyltransferase family 1 protein, partial [Candidatus Shapirobacteria bacterium]|nr:glycosyltransferase family 1 protein [Candidatus Shapirobacteria bacterium]